MEIAILNDTHAGSRQDQQNMMRYMSRFFENEFFPEIDKRGISTIIHLGDVFDRRKFINFNTLRETKRVLFDELEKRDIQVYIIPGNHDVAYKNTNTLNSLDLLLESYSNIEIFHSPTILKFDDKRIGLVPWINSENYDETVSFIRNNSDVDLLGGHFDIQGVEMLKGVRSDEGFNQSFFSDYKQVISGHYHTPSINGNIWYPGSQYEFTWADYGQDKGYLIYDTSTDDLTKISTRSRMFHKIYYDDSDEFELKKLQSDLSKFEDKYVKVIVREKNSKTKFDQFITNLHNANAFDVSIVESDLEFGLSQDELNVETQSTMEIIDSTIDSMTVNVSTTDLKKLFHELYNEAMNIEV